MDKQNFITRGEAASFRLPLEGSVDLTYRCNCRCRHCWLSLPENDKVGKQELSFDEICRIMDEAEAMGCRRWSISGGEPMLRPDFIEIFDRITNKRLPYTLNTNGTLITPAIARLLKRKGSKMVALYGATERTHDHITRTPGSFAAAMQGIAYLREAGAAFIVQLIPMKDNRHEIKAMVRLARSLSPVYRMGAPWFYLSACRSPSRNREILRQRLEPAEAILTDPPDMMDDEAVAPVAGDKRSVSKPLPGDDRLFAACVDTCRAFHIDPYGGMTFCCFVKEPALRYNLKEGTFREAWEDFIPSLADRVRGGPEYDENCSRCDKRADCRWCPVYAYLEHGRYPARISYLCELTDAERSYRENRRRRHRRYFQIAGITVRVDSDLPFTNRTLNPKFEKFRTEGPGEEMIVLSHHFSLPKWNRDDQCEEVYNRSPWEIYRKNRSWIYLNIEPKNKGGTVYGAAVFNTGHTRGRIYHKNGGAFRRGNLHAITLLPSDQIMLARILADHRACFFHAAGIVIDGKGLLLVGHSGSGKTTAAKLLKNHGEILCDDRIVVRKWPEGFRIHGTWSHGDLTDVSSGAAPLAAVLFLEKADTNGLVPVTKKAEIAQELVQYPIKALVTADWWGKILDLIEDMAGSVPVYRLRFDKSGRINDIVRKIV